MAGAFRILLWAVVLLAPGGILLAPLLAAHELRRRNRANREAAERTSVTVNAGEGAPLPVVGVAVAESSAGQLAA